MLHMLFKETSCDQHQIGLQLPHPEALAKPALFPMHLGSFRRTQAGLNAPRFVSMRPGCFSIHQIATEARALFFSTPNWRPGCFQ